MGHGSEFSLCTAPGYNILSSLIIIFSCDGLFSMTAFLLGCYPAKIVHVVTCYSPLSNFYNKIKALTSL